MRIPIDWLAELVELPTEATAESVMAELVKVGLEEEGVHGATLTGPIVVGQVLEFVPEQQSNGKTIRWCQVRVALGDEPMSDGGTSVRGVVCGASNFEVGDKVAVTLPGAILPGGFQIAARKTYGHVSDGMIASQRELGMGEDHEGILVFSRLGLDPEIGSDVITLLGLGQTAAEVNVTPDRGYCLSMRGIAREYAHATRQGFIDPVAKLAAFPVSGFQLAVNDELTLRGRDGCEGFYAIAMEGINATAPTPDWMKSRLQLAGMRSISIAVDISNYVMLELGQPNHTYDLDKLSGGITVRRAANGEQLVTLDGKTRTLDAEDLLITDESGPIGLAGVMGGASTEVTNSTTRVLIEAAHFDPISIARSARRHRLVSEASKRFERGVDPKLAPLAAARVVELLSTLAGGRVIANASSSFGGHIQPSSHSNPIHLPKAFASELVGVAYSPEQSRILLEEIGCVVSEKGQAWEVLPPSWRPDLTHKTDLVEEIARLSGYELIPSVIPVAPPGRGLNAAQLLRKRVVGALAAAGLVEVLNYPFVSAQEVADFQPDTKAVRLLNPIQEESPFLRTSLLPGLLQAAARNRARAAGSIRVYEEGSVFSGSVDVTTALPAASSRPSPGALDLLAKSIPVQPRMLGALQVGPVWPQSPMQAARSADFSDAATLVELIGLQAGVAFSFRQATLPGWHPGRCAELFVNHQRVGVAGEIHPELVARFHLSDRVAAVEINLDQLLALQPTQILAKELRVMPAATQDISLIVQEGIPAAEISTSIVSEGGDLLEAVELRDVFAGASIPPGQKSLTFQLTFRDRERTLTQKEVTEVRERIVERLVVDHRVEFRG